MLKQCKPPRMANYVCSGNGTYVATSDGSSGVYVGNWCIDADVLYHRHPSEVGYDMIGAEGVKEYDVNDRVCWKCATRCPDSIWFAHRLQQLP